MRRWQVVLGAVLLISCGSNQRPEIVDVRRVPSSSGIPKVLKVTDLGVAARPTGHLQLGRGDGAGVIGELVYVEGSDFGKQPRVVIGGRATEVVAFTKSGVVARVPWGIDPGEVEVEVSHKSGRHGITFPVKRLGLVLHEKGIKVIEVKADGSVTPGPELVLPGGGSERKKIVFSPDGSVAYVAGGAGQVQLWVVDLTDPSPKVVTTRTFPGERVIDLETAEQADLGALVTDTHVVYFDSRQVLNPAFYTPHPIPKELRDKSILTAALGGQGKSLALLLSDLNQVAVIDCSKLTVLAPAEVVSLLPDARLQVVSDIRFSADGTTIWVASGDTSRSIAGGFQPFQITLVKVASSKESKSGRKVEVHQTWDLGEKMSCKMLALARGEPIPPGTSIRPEPSTSSVYIVAHPSGILKEGFSAGGSEWKSSVLRTSLDNKQGEAVASGPWLLTALDVVGKTQVLVALGVQQLAGKLKRVLVHGRAWRGGKPKTLVLPDLPPGQLRAPIWVGDVRVQP